MKVWIKSALARLKDFFYEIVFFIGALGTHSWKVFMWMSLS